MTKRSAIGLMALLAIGGAPAAQALRCGSALVALGDHEVEVRDRCGDPEYVDSRILYPYELRGAEAGRVVHVLPWPIRVEEWVYDRGSQRFRQLLRFRDGRVIGIEALDKAR